MSKLSVAGKKNALLTRDTYIIHTNGLSVAPKSFISAEQAVYLWGVRDQSVFHAHERAQYKSQGIMCHGHICIHRIFPHDTSLILVIYFEDNFSHAFSGEAENVSLCPSFRVGHYKSGSAAVASYGTVQQGFSFSISENFHDEATSNILMPQGCKTLKMDGLSISSK